MTEVNTFIVPRGVDTFIEEVKDRVGTFIDTRIWEGTDRATFENWFIQFVTIEEKYFASIILDNILFRSREQIISGLEHLLHTILPNIDIIKAQYPTIECDWYRQIRHSPLNKKIVFCPVIKRSFPPTKSSFVVLREMHKKFKMPDYCFIWPQDLSNNRDKVIIFIDDFLGTGTQFSEFADEYKLSDLSSDKILYSPIIATKFGIEAIKCIPVHPVEIADGSETVIKDDNNIFIDGINSNSAAKRFYLEMVNKWGFPPKYLCGFENLSMLIAFYHNVPNNSLPLLWCEKNNFTPLFQR